VQHKQLSIVFAGGGTGGHLFPGIAVADEVRRIEPDARITFIGTRRKIESRVIPQHGYGFEAILVSGFRRKLTLENLLFPMRFVIALVQSLFLMRKLRPDAVVGTGGYVAGPPLFVASLLGIPTLIQEQNSYPGVTTRLLSSRARQVHLSFKSSERYLKRRDNVYISGNPTRREIGKISREEARALFSLDASRPVLLVFGGSLGASSINNGVLKSLPGLISKGVQIVWQTGEADFARIDAEASRQSRESGGAVKVQKFIDRMEYAYAACDLALCRAGATTVAELANAGVPSVLVPYPYAAADHQTENARAMVDAGAAVMIKDSDLAGQLFETIEKLLADPGKLQAMRQAAMGVGKPDAAAAIARSVLALARPEHERD
jgi:UDP-N-acetylglucosamine--N-acetylmuramyl-(pentapeptide) pyrophosphoryl-undecaprenol N-acetylglucosamine transferase